MYLLCLASKGARLECWAFEPDSQTTIEIFLDEESGRLLRRRTSAKQPARCTSGEPHSSAHSYCDSFGHGEASEAAVQLGLMYADELVIRFSEPLSPSSEQGFRSFLSSGLTESEGERAWLSELTSDRRYASIRYSLSHLSQYLTFFPGFLEPEALRSRFLRKSADAMPEILYWEPTLLNTRG